MVAVEELEFLRLEVVARLGRRVDDADGEETGEELETNGPAVAEGS